MALDETALPAVLRERAYLTPAATAFTSVGYGHDSVPVLETLTWSQLYLRSSRVARELQQCGPAGGRALILVPQGLHYVDAFLGALQAGHIAVPLSVLDVGSNQEHIRSVLRDTAPSAILTTSAVAPMLVALVGSGDGAPTPSIVAVDALAGETSGFVARDAPGTAYLQYTSGSTRRPTGVEVTYRNLQNNFEHVMATYFDEYGNVAPPDTTVVSWVPLYHNMGLFIGLCAPILAGLRTVLLNPLSFLERPARWMQLLATNPLAFSPTPNFAMDLAARATTDDDMAGLDLGNVLALIAGGERIHPATIRRFTERFARFNLHDRVIRPSYGLAEATVYVASRATGGAPEIVRFASEPMSTGTAERSTDDCGTALVSYGIPRQPLVRIVDPDTHSEKSAGAIGEIWVHGESVARGYWQKPDETSDTFRAKIVAASDGTPEGPWLRTGDLGALSDGELFIMGRIKDVLIVYGRNHYPDDIEATVSQITNGRVAAFAVDQDHAEQLVVVVELDEKAVADDVKRQVTSALSAAHGLTVGDLVVVAAGSIPITRSGKVSRSACAERYGRRELVRVDG